jgi:hypothetical protein
MTRLRVDYDADSLLPLGWEWGEDEWPGCDRILPTAHGPHGERFAKYAGKTYSAGFDATPSEFLGRACDALAKVRRP